MSAVDWLLDADPSIRWQTLRDLVGAPAEVVTAERRRVAREGWGARLLAMQGDDGLWEGGALFPARDGKSLPWSREDGQPWTATAYALEQLVEFGVDPHYERVRAAVASGAAHRVTLTLPPSRMQAQRPAGQRAATYLPAVALAGRKVHGGGAV